MSFLIFGRYNACLIFRKKEVVSPCMGLMISIAFYTFPLWKAAYALPVNISIFLFALLIISILIIAIFRSQKLGYKYQLDVDKKMKFLQSAINNQELNRLKIGHDLYEEIAPLLSAIRLQMDKCVEGENIEKELMVELKDNLDLAISRIRLASAEMLPDVLMVFGLNEAIRDLIRRIALTTEVDIDMRIDENLDKFVPHEDKTVIYRAVQETINALLDRSQRNTLRLSANIEQFKLTIFIWNSGMKKEQERDTLLLQNLGNSEAMLESIGAKLEKVMDNNGITVKIRKQYKNLN